MYYCVEIFKHVYFTFLYHRLDFNLTGKERDLCKYGINHPKADLVKGQGTHVPRALDI